MEGTDASDHDANFAGLFTGAIHTLVAIGHNITLTSSGVLNFAFANTLVFGGFVAISAVAAGLPVPLQKGRDGLPCEFTESLTRRGGIRWSLHRVPSGAAPARPYRRSCNSASGITWRW